MPESGFITRLKEAWKANKYVAVGLDPDVTKLPSPIADIASIDEAFFAFNKAIIDETAELAAAYKLNSAFYEAGGEAGYRALKRTTAYIADEYPELLVIIDAKRGDIGNTNEQYARSLLEDLGADAITVHPYLGREAAEPFLKRHDKGVFVLARTSNSGAKEFQDLSVDGEPLYMRVARNVSKDWNVNGNCGLVVGATYVDELTQVRTVAPALPILIPGVGAQGGNAREAFNAGKTADGGLLITVSRSIIYASKGDEFAQDARKELEKISSELA